MKEAPAPAAQEPDADESAAPPSLRKRVRFTQRDWNFDERRVPDAELVACCYWEYARESRLLRDLRQKCEQAWREAGSYDPLIPIVAGNIRHSNISVEVFLREIVLLCPSGLWQSTDPAQPLYRQTDFIPSLTSAFPASWQSLASNERASRAASVDLKVKPYFAFRRGRLRDVRAIERTVMHQRKVALNPNIDPLEVSSIAMLCPLVADAPFEWTDQSDRLPGGFLYPNGTEVSVVEIDWAHCTDKEIAKWVANYRPASIPDPKDTGGHKREDWRATLERLGLLRLRSRYTVERTIAIIAARLTLDQRRRGKFIEPGECNREAEKAVADYHDLFPFLDPAEQPLSWPPQ